MVLITEPSWEVTSCRSNAKATQQTQQHPSKIGSSLSCKRSRPTIAFYPVLCLVDIEWSTILYHRNSTFAVRDTALSVHFMDVMRSLQDIIPIQNSPLKSSSDLWLPRSRSCELVVLRMTDWPFTTPYTFQENTCTSPILSQSSLANKWLWPTSFDMKSCSSHHIFHCISPYHEHTIRTHALPNCTFHITEVRNCFHWQQCRVRQNYGK